MILMKKFAHTYVSDVWSRCKISEYFKGYRMVIKIFRVLAKFGLCSICSQNLDECSLARARKIFAIARMLGFSLKFALLLKIL